MSNQIRLQALTRRLSGEHYIGRKTVNYQPQFLVRQVQKKVETYGKPILKYTRDPDIESFETISGSSGDEKDDKTKEKPRQPLEYRITGITWHTPRYVNTCNMDSFLSAWVRKMRQTHGKYLKHVQIIDRVGSALYELADHALCAKERIDAEFVKGLWLIAVLKSTDEIDCLRKPPLDCTGYNAYSIFQHLENHNTLEIVSKCKCGTFFHFDYILEVPDLKQVEILGNPRNLNDAEMPKCLTCNEPRILLELNPYKTNWLLVFNYNGSRSRNNQSPLLSEIPQILQVGNIMFKLEYIAYCQDVPSHPNEYHEVSLQFIRHKWYLYDGCRSPKFRKWNSSKYDQYNARLNTIVYFKI